jgi:hypothetical protein
MTQYFKTKRANKLNALCRHHRVHREMSFQSFRKTWEKNISKCSRFSKLQQLLVRASKSYFLGFFASFRSSFHGNAGGIEALWP